MSADDYITHLLTENNEISEKLTLHFQRFHSGSKYPGIGHAFLVPEVSTYVNFFSNTYEGQAHSIAVSSSRFDLRQRNSCSITRGSNWFHPVQFRRLVY